ncbi:MAG: alpha/beta hydrolase [Planctomycetes bacterium]|nr:alpha/beta hydrolase [Planctomycetota bacterium]
MSQTTDRGGRRIHFLEHGEGEPIILVPGLGGGARVFGTLPRRFGRNGFRCLSVDPVGLPPSGPLPDGEFVFDDAADDLIAVLDATGVERATLVGTSLGGKTALTAAARHPERVARLVMLASAAYTSQRARRVYSFFQTIAEKLEPTEFAVVVAPFLFGRTFHQNLPAVVDDIIRATRPTADARALMQSQAKALRSFDGLSLCQAVRCPTLCVAGLEDTLTGVDEVRTTAEAIRTAEYLEIADAGHTLLLESPATFDAVCSFAAARS